MSQQRLSPPSAERGVLCGRCRFGASCIYCDPVCMPMRRCAGFLPLLRGSTPATEVLDELPQGLCRSCNLAEHCTRERPSSGVWHCEGYG